MATAAAANGGRRETLARPYRLKKSGSSVETCSCLLALCAQNLYFFQQGPLRLMFLPLEEVTELAFEVLASAFSAIT